MAKNRERIESWLSRRKNRDRDREAIEVLLVIADACDIAIERGQLSDEEARLLLDGAGSKRAILCSNTIELVNVLQVNGIDSGQVVRTLFQSNRAKIRLVALCCVKGGATPNTLLDELLIAALSDKSPGVCAEAAQIATIYFRKKWLVPNMEGAAQKYKGGAYFQQLLRDGFIANQLRDGTHWLEVLTESNGVRPSSVSAADMEARGLDTIVEELQRCAPGESPIPVEEHRIFDDRIPNPFNRIAPLYRKYCGY